MSEEILQGFGKYLEAIVTAVIAMIAFWIGHSVNGIMPELATMICTILGATEIFAIFVIHKLTKIEV